MNDLRPGFLLRFSEEEANQCWLELGNFCAESGGVIQALTVHPSESRFALFALLVDKRIAVYAESRANGYAVSVQFTVKNPDPELWLQICADTGKVDLVDKPLDLLLVVVNWIFEGDELDTWLANYEKQKFFHLVVMTEEVGDDVRYDTLKVHHMGRKIPNYAIVGPVN